MPRPQRVDFNASQFVTGTSAAIEAIRLAAEANLIRIGNETTDAVRADWPVGEARTRRKEAGQHTKDGITGTHRHTKRGRLVYEIRVPFPGGFVEFGTRKMRRRPILRTRMAQARQKIAEG